MVHAKRFWSIISSYWKLRMGCGHWMDPTKHGVGPLMVIMSLNNMPTTHDKYFLQPLAI